MRYLKKVISISLVVLLLTGCVVNHNTYVTESSDIKISDTMDIKSSSDMYHNVKKIHDYLYEITYDDYTFDENLDTISDVEAFGCSSVRNGNYYGRNFDYVFNDTPEFVVRMKAKEGRHASIGIATHFGLREREMMGGEYDKQLELVPNFTLDGLNDAGVICSHNVVPYADVQEVTGTNPDGENLHMLMIPRFVLDNASSADEAVELLKSRNIYGNLHENYYLHIMIADKNKTYVVEFLDNKVVAEEKTGDEQIMTNYYVNLPEYTENAMGIERYDILKENYNEGATRQGMRNLMQRVRFSQAYRFANDPEYYSEAIPQSILKNKDSNKEEFDMMVEIFNKLKQDYWIAKANDYRSPANPALWHTTHCSVYDMVEDELYIMVQEDYANYYVYDLDELK